MGDLQVGNLGIDTLIANILVSSFKKLTFEQYDLRIYWTNFYQIFTVW